MKRILLACLFLSAIGFYSFRTINQKYSDILSALGISPELAKDKVFFTLIRGNFSAPRNPNIKTYPASKRAEAVQQLGSFAKNYLMSVEFQKRYMDNYEQSKPRMPESVEQRVKMQVDNYKQDLKKYEENITKAEEQYKKIYEQGIANAKKWIRIYEDPKDPEHDKYMGFIKMGYDAEMKYYNDQLTELEKKYPKDIKQFIKQRLNEFLTLSAGVDYNAETKQSGKHTVFVNPAYESKGNQWKYCFRAGKETIDAAREFAKQWLKELGQ